MESIDLKIPAETISSLVTTINTSIYRIKIFYTHMYITTSCQVKLCNVQEIDVYDSSNNWNVITMMNDESKVLQGVFPIDYNLLKELNFEVIKEYGYVSLIL